MGILASFLSLNLSPVVNIIEDVNANWVDRIFMDMEWLGGERGWAEWSVDNQKAMAWGELVLYRSRDSQR